MSNYRLASNESEIGRVDLYPGSPGSGGLDFRSELAKPTGLFISMSRARSTSISRPNTIKDTIGRLGHQAHTLEFSVIFALWTVRKSLSRQYSLFITGKRLLYAHCSEGINIFKSSTMLVIKASSVYSAIWFLGEVDAKLLLTVVFSKLTCFIIGPAVMCQSVKQPQHPDYALIMFVANIGVRGYPCHVFRRTFTNS